MRGCVTHADRKLLAKEKRKVFPEKRGKHCCWAWPHVAKYCPPLLGWYDRPSGRNIRQCSQHTSWSANPTLGRIACKLAYFACPLPSFINVVFTQIRFYSHTGIFPIHSRGKKSLSYVFPWNLRQTHEICGLKSNKPFRSESVLFKADLIRS